MRAPYGYVVLDRVAAGKGVQVDAPGQVDRLVEGGRVADHVFDQVVADDAHAALRAVVLCDLDATGIVGLRAHPMDRVEFDHIAEARALEGDAVTRAVPDQVVRDQAVGRLAAGQDHTADVLVDRAEPAHGAVGDLAVVGVDQQYPALGRIFDRAANEPVPAAAVRGEGRTSAVLEPARLNDTVARTFPVEHAFLSQSPAGATVVQGHVREANREAGERDGLNRLSVLDVALEPHQIAHDRGHHFELADGDGRHEQQLAGGPVQVPLAGTVQCIRHVLDEIPIARTQLGFGLRPRDVDHALGCIHRGDRQDLLDGAAIAGGEDVHLGAGSGGPLRVQLAGRVPELRRLSAADRHPKLFALAGGEILRLNQEHVLPCRRGLEFRPRRLPAGIVAQGVGIDVEAASLHVPPDQRVPALVKPDHGATPPPYLPPAPGVRQVVERNGSAVVDRQRCPLAHPGRSPFRVGILGAVQHPEHVLAIRGDVDLVLEPVAAVVNADHTSPETVRPRCHVGKALPQRIDRIHVRRPRPGQAPVVGEELAEIPRPRLDLGELDRVEPVALLLPALDPASAPQHRLLARVRRVTDRRRLSTRIGRREHNRLRDRVDAASEQHRDRLIRLCRTPIPHRIPRPGQAGERLLPRSRGGITAAGRHEEVRRREPRGSLSV